MTEIEKSCRKCKRSYPLHQFYNDKSSKDGKQRYCKYCMKEYHKSSENKYCKRTITKLLSRDDMTLDKLRMYYGILV